MPVGPVEVPRVAVTFVVGLWGKKPQTNWIEMKMLHTQTVLAGIGWLLISEF